MQRTALIIFLIGLGMLGFGILGIFSPDTAAGALDLLAINESGSSAIRSMIGGHYAAMGILLILGARGRPDALRAVALIEGAMVVGRIIGLLDGELNATVAFLTVSEIILVGYLLFASGRLTR